MRGRYAHGGSPLAQHPAESGCADIAAVDAATLRFEAHAGHRHRRETARSYINHLPEGVASLENGCAFRRLFATIAVTPITAEDRIPADHLECDQPNIKPTQGQIRSYPRGKNLTEQSEIQHFDPAYHCKRRGSSLLRKHVCSAG